MFSIIKHISLAAVTSLSFVILLGNAASSYGSAITPRLELENTRIRLEFDPGIGRVVFFGWRGGENLLWMNNAEDMRKEYELGGWKNYGGEKIWPGPQALWPFASGRGWPPDKSFDGKGIERVEQCSELSFTVVFPASDVWGVRLSRTFALDAEQPRVRITNTLTRERHVPIPLQIWSVAQIKHPSSTWLQSEQLTPTGETYINLNKAPNKPPFTPPPFPEGTVSSRNGWTVVLEKPSKRMKAGTLGSVIASVLADTLFVQRSAFQPDGIYPEASSVQVLLNPYYAEIETLSPMILLDVGESYTFEFIWELSKLPQDADFAEIEAELQSVLAK